MEKKIIFWGEAGLLQYAFGDYSTWEQKQSKGLIEKSDFAQ